MKITTTEELIRKIEKIKEAQKIYSTYSQEQVDKIFKAAAIAANKERIKLAKMAVEETGMGIVEDKVIKIILHLNISITNTKMKNLRGNRKR